MNTNTTIPTTPAQHTPTPWEIFPNYETGTCSIGHYGKSAPLVNHVCELPDIQSHDAAFIVRACNNHEQLVGMLEDAALQLNRLTGPNLETYARTFAVLARASLSAAK